MSDRFAVGIAGKMSKGRIDPLNRPVGIRNGDRIGGRFERNRLEPGEFLQLPLLTDIDPDSEDTGFPIKRNANAAQENEPFTTIRGDEKRFELGSPIFENLAHRFGDGTEALRCNRGHDPALHHIGGLVTEKIDIPPLDRPRGVENDDDRRQSLDDRVRECERVPGVIGRARHFCGGSPYQEEGHDRNEHRRSKHGIRNQEARFKHCHPRGLPDCKRALIESVQLVGSNIDHMVGCGAFPRVEPNGGGKVTAEALLRDLLGGADPSHVGAIQEGN
jgi:hypothetical protein